MAVYNRLTTIRAQSAQIRDLVGRTHQIVAAAKELLSGPVPHTFAGRTTTHEPFPEKMTSKLTSLFFALAAVARAWGHVVSVTWSSAEEWASEGIAQHILISKLFAVTKLVASVAKLLNIGALPAAKRRAFIA